MNEKNYPKYWIIIWMKKIIQNIEHWKRVIRPVRCEIYLKSKIISRFYNLKNKSLEYRIGFGCSILKILFVPLLTF